MVESDTMRNGLRNYPLRYLLKQARGTVGASQQKAAVMIGVSCATISRWESGLCQPQVRHINSIAAIYNLEPKRIAKLLR